MSEYFRQQIRRDLYPVHFSNIKFRTNFSNCVRSALLNRQWKETEEDDWDVYWVEKECIYEVFDGKHLKPTQRVNHFRFYTELCRKDLLIKNLKKYKKTLEKEGRMEEAALVNFIPHTFFLPSEYYLYVEEFKKLASTDNKLLWIMKPISRCQGKGIFLISKLNQIALWRTKPGDRNKQPEKEKPKEEKEAPAPATQGQPAPPQPQQCEPYIIQRYIMNPLLLGRKKFDMRIYVLVTSYNPLVVYFYRSGFARFTHEPYNDSDIENLCTASGYAVGHLTNVEIQKGSENYDEQRGGKWLLDKLKLFLISRYGVEQVNTSFAGIQNIVLKSLQAVQKLVMHDKHCFELYGYDVLFDSNLKPWLLEVNGGPSMTANTQFDFDLKCGLLDDVLTIVDVERVMNSQQEQVGGFDLIWKNGPVRLPDNSTYSTLLGCHNNRRTQVKRLAKEAAARLKAAKA